ncbi:MAG: hypothetical protein AB7S26_04555 [Sandaracinaceae bacterium]
MIARRAPLVLAALAAILVPGALVAAQENIPERTMGVRWEDGAPSVHYSAADLIDASARRKLASGLPQTLVVRTYAYRTGGAPITFAARTCRVTFDLWEEVYRVEVREPGVDGDETHGSIEDVLARCLVSQHVPIGAAGDYEGLIGQSIYFAVLIELNPLSPDTVRRLRRWLARPAGGGRIGGEAFFGSFVSLFVNRQIGAAERTLRFRSQEVRVPR